MRKLQVCIIGVGGIGARHAQAICRWNGKADLTLVDPSESALVKAEQLIGEAGGIGDGSLILKDRCSGLPEALDLVIVATNSKERRAVVETAVEWQPRWMILEKFLFPGGKDYEVIGALLDENEIKCWVNCVRRAYPGYAGLKEFFANSETIQYEVTGRGWSLASNVIHHLDEFAGLCGDFQLVLESGSLNWPPKESNRKGYWEFEGELRAVSSRGDEFVARCEGGLPDSGIRGDRTIRIGGADREALILQSVPKVNYILDGESWEEDYHMPFQSEVTADYLESLSKTDQCALPSYSEARSLHLAVLDSIAQLAEEKLGERMESIPIS